MVRKTYKRRRTRKSYSKKRYRRKRYAKKAKTKTGKLWKYVKKATKSEAKRCDALAPTNSQYALVNPSGDNYYFLMYAGGRFLSSMRFTNNGVSDSDSNLLPSWSNFGTWRFWAPYQLKFLIPKGTNINQRIGDKIFAKYLNFKIHFSSRNLDLAPQYCSLYFVSINRSVSGTYRTDDVMHAIWDGIANFVRYGFAGEIYDGAATADVTAKYNQLMSESYCKKRRRYLKGIHIKKLHSFHTNANIHFFPSYRLVTGTGFETIGTQKPATTGEVINTLTTNPTTTGVLVGPAQFQPVSDMNAGLGEQRVVNKYITKMVPLNKEWSYSVMSAEGTTTDVGQINEYKYYLIALSSDFVKNISGQTDSQSPWVVGQPDLVYNVSCELVFNDK